MINFSMFKDSKEFKALEELTASGAVEGSAYTTFADSEIWEILEFCGIRSMGVDGVSVFDKDGDREAVWVVDWNGNMELIYSNQFWGSKLPIKYVNYIGGQYENDEWFTGDAEFPIGRSFDERASLVVSVSVQLTGLSPEDLGHFSFSKYTENGNVVVPAPHWAEGEFYVSNHTHSEVGKTCSPQELMEKVYYDLERLKEFKEDAWQYVDIEVKMVITPPGGKSFERGIVKRENYPSDHLEVGVKACVHDSWAQVWSLPLSEIMPLEDCV